MSVSDLHLSRQSSVGRAESALGCWCTVRCLRCRTCSGAESLRCYCSPDTEQQNDNNKIILKWNYILSHIHYKKKKNENGCWNMQNSKTVVNHSASLLTFWKCKKTKQMCFIFDREILVHSSIFNKFTAINLSDSLFHNCNTLLWLCIYIYTQCDFRKIVQES